MKNSIKNANNLSDEEMEDVITQLEITGVRTICNQYQVIIQYQDGHGIILNPTDTINYYFY